MKILILGHRGMLGNAVHKYLSKFYDVEITGHLWPSKEFENLIREFDGDYIINCIGAIPQRTTEFGVNSILPVFLDLNSNCKIIHPSTDCESDNDIYGISKAIATDWLLSNSSKTIIFKTSIIGVELNSADSLLCWFLQQKEAFGYTDAMWNGITTLEWAKQCKRILDEHVSSQYNVFSTNCISKFELLTIIKDVFDHQITIYSKSGIGKNKCLRGIYLGDIKQQLIELKEFYER